MTGSPPQRRLVDRGPETSGRHGGQCPDIARPRDAVELTRLTPFVGDLDMAAEARERPVERPDQPGLSVFVATHGGAAPGIGAVQEPDAAEAKRRGDTLDLADIGRLGSRQPASRQPVEQRQCGSDRTWEKRKTIVAQRPRPRRALLGLAQRTALAHVNDRNFRQRVHRSSVPANRLHQHAVLTRAPARPVRRAQIMH